MTIEELERLIKKHQDAYYSGEAELSDAAFDELWDELARRDPSNPLLQRIGADNTGGFLKLRHIMPMGSQEKAANHDAFRAWAEKLNLSSFAVQYKLDGASLELQYQNGKLRHAVTRGDGVTGDDIISNALKMTGVVRDIGIDWTGGVRGEVLMFHDIWKLNYEEKANCRNAANGVMRRKDGAGCQDLTVISYDAAAANDDSFFSAEPEKIRWLSERGFKVSPCKEIDSVEEVIEYRAQVAALRPGLPFDIDGLVIKDRVTDMNDLRGSRPSKQIAFKFDLEKAISVLRAVEWSESGATYTPIGIVDPVRLAGTTVKRANLNNPSMIRGLGLKLGSSVVIVKRGEIIPKIEGLSGGALDNAGGAPELAGIEIPSSCASCGSTLVDAGTRLYCPNPACPKRLLHRLEKWVSVLNIQEVGQKLIGQLFNKNRIRYIADLYTLEAKELADFDRMGDVSAVKVARNIMMKRELPLAAFIAGFDIEGIGELIIEKACAAGFDTLEKLRAAPVESFAAIYGIGEITARVLFDGLLETAGDMDATLAHGVIRLAAPVDNAAPLSGKSFCFTGEMHSMRRGEAEERIKRAGGSVKTSVVKGLSYLVTNNPESGSAKNKKAAEFGIEIISEESFLTLLNA